MNAQLFFSLTLSLLLFACQKDPSSITDSTSPQGKTSSVDPDSNAKDSLSSDAVKYIAYMLDSSLISEEEAILNLNNFMQRNSSKGRNAEKTIASIRPIYLNGSAKFNNKFDATVAYTFEYSNNQGFAIVAADRRIAPIICVIEDGSLADAHSVPGLSTLLSNMDGYLSSEIERFDKLRDSIKNIVAHTIVLKRGSIDFGPAPLDPKPGTDVDPNTGPGLGKYEYEYLPWTEKYRINPLIPVRWDQNDPYNAFASTIECDKNNSFRPHAGCVAIAIAQTMAYHKKPTIYKNYSYNWDEIIRYPRIYSAPDINIQNQVSNLVRTIGSEVNMKYRCDGSSALVTKVRDAFKNMGYNTPTGLGIYKTENVIESLRNNAPVLIFGAKNIFGKDGHSWIIDGYIHNYSIINYYQISTDESGNTIREKVGFGIWRHELLNHNWGWDRHNGFFTVGCLDYLNRYIRDEKSLTKPDSEYDCYISIICNIK